MSRIESGKAAAPAGAYEPACLSLSDASKKIRLGEVTSSQLTRACLDRIAIYDPKLNAFITVLHERSMAQADRRDAELKAGRWRGPLHGIPIALKDLIDTAGIRTTAGSAVFEDRVPPEDATVTTRLVAAGAVIIGKTNLCEFGMDAAYFGLSRNPWALDHFSGGSSSGSGAAVAACLCYGALGTDTGGSIRYPASFCGIVGLKPTYGLVPVRGIIPAVLSIDHCGPIARTVKDAAILLNQLAGYDRLDITSVEHSREDYVAALEQPVSSFRLGTPPAFFDRLNPEVAKAVQDAIAVLGKLTRGSRDVSLPPISQTGMDIAGTGIGVESFAYHESLYKNGAARYMLPDRRQLEAFAAIRGGDAADYVRKLWALQLLRRTIDDAFTDFDLVVLPTLRILPPTLREYTKNLYNPSPTDPQVTSNCLVFNVYGLPAISIPCGFSQGGLPIGLMIAGPRFSEGKVLALAQAYEQATEWHKRKPPLTPNTPVPLG